MPVKVISRRVFRIDCKNELIELLKRLRKNAEKQEGFVSRAAYSNISDPGEYVVISEWKTVDHWIRWKDKDKVKKLQAKIDSLIGEKTVFDVFVPEKF
jgi:heme oxygenase (mycobilin-producing)